MSSLRSDAVDCLHGVDGFGSCLPGPYRPLSAVRAGPDTTNPNPTGYAGGERLLRFSHTHVSGTGGAGRYGNIGVVPCAKRPRLNPVAFEIRREEARPGHYLAELSPGDITAELATSRHGALHRYRFAGDPGFFGLETPHIVIDPCAAIAGQCVEARIAWSDDRVCEGHGVLRGGWGHDEPYTVYFSAALRSQPLRRWAQNGVQINPDRADGPGCFAVAAFPAGATVELEVGISYVSVAQARAHRERELAGRAFDALVEEGAGEWEALLETFDIETSDPALRSLYYTMLYRLFAMPDDLGMDECPWFPNRGRQFNNLYCLWDSVRNANGFLALWRPQLQADLVNALLEIGDHTGWSPDAWVMGRSAQVQGGSSGDVLFLEAALKKLPGVDARRALARMLKERATPSPDPFYFGRYPDYFTLGHLPADIPQCVSRTIEYAFQDDCLARLADRLEEPAVAAEARARSARLWELWRDDLKVFAPRAREDGAWAGPADPWEPARRDFWADPWYYEGTAHDWALTVLHDIPGLIARHGGPEAFARHLDTVLARGFFLWKEIILHVPWLYHWVGQPERSAEHVRACLKAHFRPGRAGLSDNEDMGSQSSFAIGAIAGIYPVTGTDVYLVIPPLVDVVNWQVGMENRRLIIRRDKSVRGILWNGQPLGRAWLRHAELVEGGELLVGSNLNDNCSMPPPVLRGMFNSHQP